MTTWTHNGEWHWNLRRDDLGLVPLAKIYGVEGRTIRNRIKAALARLATLETKP